MLPNIEEYLPYLDGLALSAAEKEQFILTVWQLMEYQVNQAFEGDAVIEDDGVISNSSDLH